METRPSTEAYTVFRASLSLYVMVSVLASFWIVMGVVILAKRPGQWHYLAVAFGVTLISFLCLSWLQLKISSETFHYRNLSTNRVEKFTNIEKAYFATLTISPTPLGAAVFWLKPKRGKPMKVNLRTFPIKAAAILFEALDKHAIPIEVPDSWSAQRMARQIRECQARLRESAS